MPRVNRDLQRRLAARRERERRRPAAERRYRFQPAEPDTPDVELEEQLTDGEPQEASVAEPQPRARHRREGRLVQTERAAARPFGDYHLEYAYVSSDLRRLGLVVGAILVVLVILNFVLPR